MNESNQQSILNREKTKAKFHGIILLQIGREIENDAQIRGNRSNMMFN